MIPLEKQVTSLKLSRRLAHLEVKQDSLFYWWHSVEGWVILYNPATIYREGGYSAFTVAELGEMLPRTIQWHNLEHTLSYSIDDYGHKGPLHRAHYKRGTNSISSGGFKTEADARAKMLIYLIKNKLMEAK